MPLPQEPFETGRLFTPRVDRYSQINVRTNRYSVPTRFIGKRVRVVLHASHLVVYDRNVEVARHERLIAKGGLRLDLDHYLEALIRKPGAFPGATALEQARSAGKFTPVHDAWWGPGPQGPRRAGRHPGADRGPTAEPSPRPRACRRGPGHRAAGRRPDRRRCCPGGSQGRTGGRRADHRHIHSADARRDAGDRHAAARVAPGTPSPGHPAAAVSDPLRPTATTPPHQRQRPP